MIENLDYKLHNEREKLEEKLTEAEKEERLCELAEEIFQKSNEIGVGQSAHVFKDPETEGLCYKVIHTPQELICDVHEESEFLEQVMDLHPDVKVPRPILSIIASVTKNNGERKKESILAMEEIKGFTLEDLVNYREGANLPEDFSVDNFMSSLREFFKRMHEKNIYHRDFHNRNIMIEGDTGKPAVIDFGLAAKTYLTDEDPYKTEPNIRGKVFVFKNDLEQLDEIEQSLRSYLTQK